MVETDTSTNDRQNRCVTKNGKNRTKNSYAYTICYTQKWWAKHQCEQRNSKKKKKKKREYKVTHC